ncbi:GntR family transcriptional regulator [Kocuria nitroreducens]|uniref:GntR family transcriptional regulator n=1 Tax=Kocuria nitroreducens TaxID=3058914 RepID=UPI0036D88E07
MPPLPPAAASAADAPRHQLSPAPVLSRRDSVVQELRRAAVRGTLRPGDKLTEVNLSETLAVSRPTIREALSQLAQEGLLVQEPYRGLRVASLESAQILDIAKTRQALDMLAVDAILEDESGGRMTAVQDCWAEFSRWENDPDPLTRHEAHVAFHRGIWAASENSMLLRMWPVTEAHLTIALAHDQAIRSDPARASVVHQHLIDALMSRDREQIETAFKEHTIDSACELVAIIGRENERKDDR